MSMQKKLFHSIVRFRIPIIIIWITITIAALLQAQKVQTDFNVEHYFPSHDLDKKNFDEYKLSFPDEDNRVLILIKTSTLTQDIFTKMSAIETFLKNNGLTRIQHLGNINDIWSKKEVILDENREEKEESSIEISKLFTKETIEKNSFKTLFSKVIHQKEFEGFYWNKPGNIFGLHARLSKEFNNEIGREKLRVELESMVSQLSLDKSDVVITGIPVIRSQIVSLINEDQARLFPFTFALIILVLFFTMRNFSHVILSLITLVPAIIWTSAIMALTKTPITVLTSITPIITLVIGLSDSIHILAHFRNELRVSSSSKEAVIHSFSEMIIPCFFTAITTAMGFFSLTLTNIELVGQFGIFTGIGVLLAFLNVMTFTSSVLSFSKKKVYPRSLLESERLTPFFLFCNELSTKHPKKFMLVNVLLFVFSFYSAFQIPSLAHLVGDISFQHPVRKNMEFAENNYNGVFFLNVFLKGKTENALSSYQTLKTVEEIQAFIEKEEPVVKTFSLADVVKRAHKAFYDNDSQYYHIPDSDEAISQLLLTVEMSDRDYYHDVYVPDNNTSQIMVFVKDLGSQKMDAAIQNIKKYIQNHTIPNVEMEVTGTVVLAEKVFATVLNSFLWSVLPDLIVIALAFFIMLGSFSFMILALIPNIYPMFLILGFMYLSGITFRPSTVMVFSIVFGIVVDDTIHFSAWIRRMMKEKNMDIKDAISDALLGCGRPMISTAIIISIGFSVLLFSEFDALIYMGGMTALALIIGIYADLMFFPACLKWITKYIKIV